MSDRWQSARCHHRAVQIGNSISAMSLDVYIKSDQGYQRQPTGYIRGNEVYNGQSNVSTTGSSSRCSSTQPSHRQSMNENKI